MYNQILAEVESLEGDQHVIKSKSNGIHSSKSPEFRIQKGDLEEELDVR